MTKMLHIKYNSKMYYYEVPELQTVNESTIFFILKFLGILFYNPPQFWCFLLYQYLLNYIISLNITYPNTWVYVGDINCYPFYMGLYLYVRQ